MSKSSQVRHRAQDFLKKGKLDKAIEEYKKLIQIESRNPNLYNELGDLFLRATDRVQAISCFEKAAVNYEKVALYNNAIAVCKKILRVIPNRLDTIFKLGELKAKQKFHGEAAAYFSQYLQRVLAEDSSVPRDGIQEKLELIIEYMRERDDIIGTVADVYSAFGFKFKAAELLAELGSRLEEEGDSQRAEVYRRKVESLKSSLSSEELEELGGQLSTTAEAGDGAGDDPGAVVEEAFDASERIEPEETADAETAPAAPGPAEASAILLDQAPAGETGTGGPVAADAPSPAADEVDAASTADDGAPEGVNGAAAGSVGGAQGAAAARPAVSGEGTSTAEGAGMAAQAVAVEERVAAEEAPDASTGEAVEIPSEEIAEGRPDVAADESSDEEARDFAREITSDVEEDDYRSHYDLGMAYIEMALYDDAVKELQIASRSEQLHLRSIEMIGHCFLKQNNPRLAVKQLQRGLEKVKEAGIENLGIHYNLGLAHEMLEEGDKAREYFEEVYIVDVTFRDIAEKMKKYSNTK